MKVSVSQAAERSGLSPRRIRELAASGRLPAERVGSSWVIEDAAIAAFEPRIARPMSPRNAWGLIQLLAGERPKDLSPSEISRLRQRRNELVHAEPGRAAQILRSWLVDRAQRHLYRIPSSDVPDLLADKDLLASGLSDPRSGISAASVAEGYVSPERLDSLVRRHLLIKSDNPNANVIIHVPESDWWSSIKLPDEAIPMPLFLVAADLADYNSPRENNRVDELIGQLL